MRKTLHKRALLIATILIIGCLPAMAQSVTLNLRNVTVEAAMNQLKKVSGYSFVFYDSDLNLQRHVNVQANNAPLTSVVKQIVAGQDVVFKIKGKNIVVTKRRDTHEGATESQTPSDKKERVTGQIIDKEGTPIIGATIRVKGSQTGAVSDLNGNFVLTADKNDELEISYVGYTTVTQRVNGHSIKVTLQEDSKLINEVVVVGYGTMKKSDLTGSVISVQEGNFTEGINTNAFQMINGKAAGVNISQTSSAPGASTKIQIRGAGSINSSNAALVVVDGLPDVDPSSINPDDIKSIEILKDASAAAIYGTRAANGVVLITTKSGDKSKLTVRFGAEMGVQSVAKKIDVLNAQDYMRILNEIRKESNNPDGIIFTDDQIKAAGTGTNWQNEIFRDGAPVQNYNLSLSGGGQNHTVYAGLGYMNQKGVVKESDLTKYNVRANMSFTPVDILRFKFNLNYTRTDGNAIFESNSVNEMAGPINSALQFDPTLPSGTHPETGRYYTNNYISLDNPKATLFGINTDKHTNDFYGTLAMELEPIKNLVLTARFGAKVRNYSNNQYRTKNTILGLAKGGEGTKRTEDTTQWLAEFLANYIWEINKNNTLTAMLGTTFEQFQTDYHTGTASGFLSDKLGVNYLHGGDNDKGDDVFSGKSRNRLNGFLGRLNYNLLDRYMLTASFRYDGTSRFSSAHKFAFFPSLALAWRVTEEPFMKNFKALSALKVRLGYGRLGNQGIGNYQTIQTLIPGGYAVFGNSLIQGVVLSRLPNPGLKWETTEEMNLGFDYGWLNNRISGSLDFYIKDTKNQLFDKPLPSSIGFSSIKVNAGKVRNMGVDFTLNTVNIIQKDFSWETGLNLSYLKNEVKELPSYIPELITGSAASFISGYEITRVGDPIYSFYGFKVDGIFQKDDDIAHSAQPKAKPGHLKFHDHDKSGTITSEDRVILGKPFPDVTLGLNNKLRYKDFTLSIFLQGVFGIDMLDMNVLESFYPTNEYRNRIAKYYLNRWTPTNPTNEYPSGVNPSEYGEQYSINSKTVVDASYLRIKNINLTYNIPLKSRNIVKSAQAYIAIDNLHTFTSYDGYDPDASAAGTSSVSKVNYNSYPLARSYRIGFNLTF